MLFIFFLALILFGPKKLPEIGREIGKFLAEFKRASNDFKSQLQSEIEKSGVDVSSMTGSGGQQTSSFTQTLLPPAVKSTLSELDEAQERLRRAARMAFDAQNYTVQPPEAPTVAANTEPTPAEPANAVPESTTENPAESASQAASMAAGTTSTAQPEAHSVAPYPAAKPEDNSATQSS